MPPTNPSKPGPRPTSCLTCRQRRKKCDLNRPHCERCLKGGFECLGYNNITVHASVHRVGPLNPTLPQLRPILPAIPAQKACLRRDQVLNSPMVGLSVLNDTRNNVPPIIGTGPRVIMDRPLPEPNSSYGTPSFPEDLNHTWVSSYIQLTNYRRSLARRSRSAGKPSKAATGVQPTWDYFAKVIEALCTFIPPSVDSTQAMKETYFGHIIHEYQLQRVSCCFMTPPASIRDPLINRLVGSKATMWAMYLGVKIFHALDRDPHGTKIRGCLGWIDKFEQKFVIDSNSSSSPSDAADWLFAQLELVYLSFIMIDSLSGYDLLRKALPKFLRLVAVDPNLTLEHPNGSLVVSFPQAFGGPQHELKRFIFYDTTTALVLGVPPLAEYGYDSECDPVSHGFEWVHGVPIPLVEIISQVNSWRAGSRVTPLDDWQNLESRAMAWQPQPIITKGEDSATGSVARLAVQEAWRHVALIYIYMVC
ncbi:unnamed protein product [Rhizoctonia solani]|uniref:Zn(2)-C6 fungal-type domain-containing protein n=1 Tax=Rhizoctonia solani TaxID=456999 RepID=A0A8H3E517_9AGAM|nr:unnamed protein product [Rhizoctonia solani]